MAELIQSAGLTGVVLIDIAIGLIFAVLTFSLVATALQEAIAGVLNYRGEHLRKGILRMINQGEIAAEVLSHPLINSLKGPKNLVQKVCSVLFMWGDAARDKERMPSAIPKATFARALVESLVNRREDLAATVGATADSALSALGQEIDHLTIDRRLKARLLAVVSRIDFSRVEQGIGAQVDAVAGKAEAVARDLGLEIDRLDLDGTIAEQLKERLSGLDLENRAEALQHKVMGAIDGLDLEAAARAHVHQTLDQIDFVGIERRVTAAIDHATARAEEALEHAVTAIEHELADWFDSAMDRVTGWYVRRAKTMLFVIGFLSAAVMNFDLIGYAKQLADDDALRSAIVQRAQAATVSGQVGSFTLDAPRIAQTAAETADKDPATLTEEELTARRAMSFFDSDRNGEIDAAELARADQTLRAALGLVADNADNAITTITSEFADQGVKLGAPFWSAPLMDKLRMVLSWLMIGLGCTLGGQFWFDLLKTIFKVRAGASGLNSDIEKLARDLSGQRSASGSSPGS